MNPQNIYEGLAVEPAKPVPAIHLIGKVLSDTSFAFLPANLEAALKPYSKAKWKREAQIISGNFTVSCPNHYELKQGAFLVFPEFKTKGGFYAAHLYMIVKELKDLMRRAEFQRVDGTFTGEGLELRPCEPVDGIKTCLTLKYRAPQPQDSFYHVVISY